MNFGENNGRGWAARLTFAALALATALAWVAPVSAFRIEGFFYDAEGNVAFTGEVDCKRTAASVKKGAEKPTTVFWTNGDLKGAYPYAALNEASKEAVDQKLAAFNRAREQEWKEAVEKSAAKRKAEWANAPTLPLGFERVQGKKVAVLIGCGQYKDKTNISPLPCAAADAKLLADRLRECGFDEKNIFVYTDEEATRETVFDSIKLLAQASKPGDLILVAFSGGSLEKNGETYLVPSDFDFDSENCVETSGVSLREYAERLETAAPGRAKALFIDAPHSGGKTLANVWTLCACNADEDAEVGDFDGKEYSVFSYFFAEGLTERGDANGDGVVTLMEAFLYARACSIAETEIKNNVLALRGGPVAYGPLADVAMRDLNAAPQNAESEEEPEVAR